MRTATLFLVLATLALGAPVKTGSSGLDKAVAGHDQPDNGHCDKADQTCRESICGPPAAFVALSLGHHLRSDNHHARNEHATHESVGHVQVGHYDAAVDVPNVSPASPRNICAADFDFGS